MDVFEAAASGDIDYLKNNIARLNDKNERGWTPLHYAARFGQEGVVRFLLKSTVDMSIVNNEGKTAYQVAVFWGNDTIGNLLIPPVTTPSVDTTAVYQHSPFPDNYKSIFAGNPMNRLSWIRSKPEVLSKMARSSTAKYIALSNLEVLFDQSRHIHYIGYNDISFLVDSVYTEDSVNKSNNDVIVVFLGIDEHSGKGTEGESLWAVDITPAGRYKNQLEQVIEGFHSNGWSFKPTLPGAFKMKESDSAVIAQAAAMVDWNKRNKFCPACGKQTMMEEGGHKRKCAPSGDHTACISQSGIQNHTYPRTDAVVIACIVHPTEDKILLGRQKRWRNKMYSCISGFVEPAETLEEAVRREAFEETGIVVDRVAYHSSQPWPFPNSLMLGFIAEAISTDIHLEDDELESAQWFDRSEVEAAIKNDADAIFTMPPKGALAYTLVTAWLYDSKWQLPHAKM